MNTKHSEHKDPVEQLQEKPGKGEFLIVGIGASAGGIQALQEFFRHVSPGSGIAYVVILHLSPDHDSQLAAVLQRETKIPVTQVTEKVNIQPNHVYVVPPNQHLAMEGNIIAVANNTSMEERRAPVDIFFRTLADEHGPRSIAVILSGTGANGSMGLKRVKERGGACFVQNPREAEFNEMPRNAIATDMVDEVLSVTDIPAKILAYKTSLGSIQITVEADKRPEEQQQALREIFTQIRVRTGHDFSNYKRPTLLRRIERRINIRNLPDLPSYAKFLQENHDEPIALLKDLLISVTNFFRDKKAFDVLEQEIMPLIFKAKNNEDQVRIWVAGCATGEEAYSIAMLCAEKTMGAIDMPKVQIFATDIDKNAIAQAREGLYSLNDTADVSTERLRRFFNKEGDNYRIRREIREMIMFAHHNFLKDPPFSHLDMVSCRNVMIYLNQTAQERVIETFHFALNPGGFLFLGTSESVDGASDLYAVYNRENHIFQSRQVSQRSYPVPESTPSLYFEKFKKERTQESENKILKRISFGDLHQQLLEEYAPPSLVVNEDYDILHLTERAGRYLQIAGGELSKNLLKLVKPELRLELRSALYQAMQRQSAVEARGLQVNMDDVIETINIHVRPVLRSGNTAKGFILIVFEAAANGPTTAHEILLSANEPLAKQLEEELIRVKTQLRAANEQHDFQAEEMKASNEELQAMNEELRSAAEELETSKEELQSINEELRTVNQERKVKIEETSIASNNLRNLINSTDIGTIFLDRSFRVVLFTPSARNIFNLIPADYGRPLSDITHKLEHNGLLEDAETVLDKLITIEKEVSTRDGRDFLMRITPYRTDEDRIKGVVMTFVDITERINLEKAKKTSEEKYTTLFTSIDEAFVLCEIILDETGKPIDYRMLELNPAFEKMTGITVEAAKGRTAKEVVPTIEEWWVETYGKVVLNHESVRFENYVSELDRWFNFYASPFGEAGSRQFVIVYTDITQRKKVQQKLENANKKMKLALESANAGYGFWNHKTGETFWDERGRAIMGFEKDENITSEDWFNRIHEEDREKVAAYSAECAAEGKEFSMEYRIKLKNGEVKYISGSGYFKKDDKNEPYESYGLVIDITDRKKAEKALQESEEKYRTLFETIDEGFCILELIYDKKGQAIDWIYREANPAFEKQTGYINPIGKSISNLEPKLERFWFDKFAGVDKTGEPVRFIEYTDAMKKWYDVYAFAVGEPGSKRVSLLFTDVTERKKVEAAVQEREERFRSYVAASFDVVYRMNADWTVMHVLEGGNFLTGSIENETWLFKYIPEAEQPKVQQVINEAIEQKKIFELEHEVIDANGNIAITYSRAIPTLNGQGEIVEWIGAATDVTQQKKAEHALHESEERLRLATAAANIYSWEYNLATDSYSFSENAAAILGITKLPATPEDSLKLTHPDDRVLIEQTLQHALKNNTGFMVDFRSLKDDGSTVWLSAQTVMIKNASGNGVRLLGIAQDISQRKKAEEALFASEERLRVTMESALDYAIVTTNTEGFITAWSKGAERIFGYTIKEVLGKSADLIFTPEDRENNVPEKEMNMALENGSAPDERWHIKKDGSRFYASGVMAPIFDGKLSGFVKVARDMTNQKQSEEKLRIFEERNRIALQSAEMASWDWDIAKDTIVWNAQHYLLFGLMPQNEEKKSAYFIQFIYPDDREMITNKLIDAVQVTGVYKAEFRIIRADNKEVRWMTGFGRAIEWEGENAKRMVGVMFDITDRKKLEQQKEEFLGIASHELKTPVTSVMAYGDLLEETIEETGDKSSAELIKKMNAQVSRLNNLITDLLDTTKISEGQLVLNFEEFDIIELIQQLAEELQKLSAKHRIVIKCDTVVNINADKKRIEQVISNLISNALKYSPDGGDVTIDCQQGETQVKVSISDMGIGIPVDLQEKIFSRFFRVQHLQSKAQTGMGLGLYISAGIIQRHGGGIGVEDNTEKGSVFYFTLPYEPK